MLQELHYYHYYTLRRQPNRARLPFRRARAPSVHPVPPVTPLLSPWSTCPPPTPTPERISRSSFIHERARTHTHTNTSARTQYFYYTAARPPPSPFPRPSLAIDPSSTDTAAAAAATAAWRQPKGRSAFGSSVSASSYPRRELIADSSGRRLCERPSARAFTLLYIYIYMHLPVEARALLHVHHSVLVRCGAPVIAKLFIYNYLFCFPMTVT